MRSTSVRLSLVAAIFLLYPAGQFTASGPGSDGTPLEHGPACGSLEPPSTLVAAMPLLNAGKTTLENLQVSAVSLRGPAGSIAGALPGNPGSLAAGDRVTVYSKFQNFSYAPGQNYVMTIQGTYGTAATRPATFSFAVHLRMPPPAPGSAKVSISSSPAQQASGGAYTSTLAAEGVDVEDEAGWTVPQGSYHAAAAPSPPTAVEPAPVGDPPNIDMFVDAHWNIHGLSTNEPSGAVGGDVVFGSANDFGAYSTNGGASFTELKPRALFPSDLDGGFCCDQIVQYAPSIDRIIWLMLFHATKLKNGSKGENRARIAAASPATIKSSHGTVWTYWDITSTQTDGSAGWLDYPDMAVGDNSLYLSFDRVGSGGFTVIRIPLAEIKTGSTIHFQFTQSADSVSAYGGHLTQHPGDAIFWAGHQSNSTLRAFSWKEGSDTYFWRDDSIGSWQDATLSSLTPDGFDWLKRGKHVPGRIMGSVRVRSGKEKDEVWFAWAASSGDKFKQTHIVLVALDLTHDFRLIKPEHEIWNDDFAYAYPAMDVNSKGEIGLSLEFGGGGNFENHAVGFLGDGKLYRTTATAQGTERFGDYVTIRANAAKPERFDAFGYGLLKDPASSNGQNDTHYVNFGR
jgi:hypothetical protein